MTALPLLPTPILTYGVPAYSSDQMHAYAEQACKERDDEIEKLPELNARFKQRELAQMDRMFELEQKLSAAARRSRDDRHRRTSAR